MGTTVPRRDVLLLLTVTVCVMTTVTLLQVSRVIVGVARVEDDDSGGGSELVTNSSLYDGEGDSSGDGDGDGDGDGAIDDDSCNGLQLTGSIYMMHTKLAFLLN